MLYSRHSQFSIYSQTKTMTVETIGRTSSNQEQRFILPGHYSWQQFKDIQATMETVPGLRLSYLDGYLTLMTTSEQHELIKKFISILLEAYLFEKSIGFIPVGNATRESENESVSFEPDESYYIGAKKEHPDLAIEIALTSGGPDKLEKYKRFKIGEVWFWEKDEISVYVLGDRRQEYSKVNQSQLFPELDLNLLAHCVQQSDIIEARTAFIQGMQP